MILSSLRTVINGLKGLAKTVCVLLKLADGLNGADMRNICTEAGLFAIRSDRDYCLEEDFMKAARKILDNKKLESKLDYSKV